MKRTLPLAATLTVVLASLAGCGTSDLTADGATSPTAPDAVVTTEPDDVTEPTGPPDPTTPATTPATNLPTTEAPTNEAPTNDAPPTSAPMTSTPSSPSASRPADRTAVAVDDGTFESVAELAANASLVIVGEVVEVSTLGRPFADRDPNANEFVAITVRTIDALAGARVDEIVLPWEAFTTDADGNRTSTLVTNGILPADIGDRLVLFLDPADPAFAELFGGAPTHQLVKLDGIAFIDGDRVVTGEADSTAAEQLVGMTITDLRSALST